MSKPHLYSSASTADILFGCDFIKDAFSFENQIKTMMQFERAYTLTLGQVGLVKVKDCELANQKMAEINLDLDKITFTMQKDGVAVPELIRQIKQQLDENLHAAIHQGATSQDVMDTATVLTLKNINQYFETDLKILIASLKKLDASFGIREMMARTRMQAALPIKCSQRIMSWVVPVKTHLNNFDAIRDSVEVLQFGGPVGDRRNLQNKGDEIAKILAQQLGLNNPNNQWQTTRSNIINYGNWVCLVTGSLGKIGQDIILMAQQGVEEIKLNGGGISSAMAHKQNPILAEKLVTLARYNATQISGLHHAMIHEQERSGSAWGLEWMVLPKMCEVLGAALETANQLCGDIIDMGTQV